MLVRLSKRMAELGLASRREADEWIARGLVSIEGHTAGLGEKVAADLPAQAIHIHKNAQVQQKQQVTIIVHKPVAYVSGQAEHGYAPAVTLITPNNHWSKDPVQKPFSRSHLHGLAPAGRLDIDSTGLLVLTQDGRIARQLIGENSNLEKEYLVRVADAQGSEQIKSRFPTDRLKQLRHGLSLDGRALKPAKVQWLNDNQLQFILTEGKKRQIRRMCELVGLKVVGLKRVRMGKVRLGALPVGQWRYLALEESF